MVNDIVPACLTGLMELNVSQLCQPPRESRLLRQADPTFISNLKDKMVKDPAAPGAAPIAVLCKTVSTVEDFNPKFRNVYKYEVLGGLHTMLAKSQLTSEYPNCPFHKVVNAEVYIGLSDEQSLRLAQRHNVTSHFTHKVTHRDLVSSLFLITFPLSATAYSRLKHAGLDCIEWLVDHMKMRPHQPQQPGKNPARLPSSHLYVHDLVCTFKAS